MTHGQLAVHELAANGHLEGRGAASGARNLNGLAEDLERLRQCNGGRPIASGSAVLDGNRQHLLSGHVSPAFVLVFPALVLLERRTTRVPRKVASEGQHQQRALAAGFTPC